jgi:hypothetical protein
MRRKQQPQQAQQDTPMDAYSVRMTAWHARRARKIGKGNLAEGVRRLIEAWTDGPPRSDKK